MKINPVAIQLGGIKIYWYSFSYIVGIYLGILYSKFLAKNKSLMKDKDKIIEKFDDFINYLVLGVIIGGRLGHCIFFDPGYYISNPLEIFYVWKGGMAFHGGCIGVALAIFFFTKKNLIDFWEFTDLIACAAPIGLFFGRIANFINQELYGSVTDSVFGVVFEFVDDNYRHPTQLYEAFSEGILLFILLFYLFKNKLFERRLAGVFLIGYSVSRFFIEYLKEPDTDLNLQIINLLSISIGQLMSCIFIFIGILIIFIVKGRKC